MSLGMKMDKLNIKKWTKQTNKNSIVPELKQQPIKQEEDEELVNLFANNNKTRLLIRALVDKQHQQRMSLLHFEGQRWKPFPSSSYYYCYFYLKIGLAWYSDISELVLYNLRL